MSHDDDSRDLGEAVTEKPKELAAEAAEGRSERTPFIALTGVTLAIAVIVGVVLTAAFLVYFLVYYLD